MRLGDHYFRIEDGWAADSKPVLQRLFVGKVTPKGGWVVHSWNWPLREPLTNAAQLHIAGAVFVKQGTRRAYAYPTIELALESYKIRKTRQIQHAENSIRAAENGLSWARRAEIEEEFVVFAEPAQKEFELPSDGPIRRLF